MLGPLAEKRLPPVGRLLSTSSSSRSTSASKSLQVMSAYSTRDSPRSRRFDLARERLVAANYPGRRLLRDHERLVRERIGPLARAPRPRRGMGGRTAAMDKGFAGTAPSDTPGRWHAMATSQSMPKSPPTSCCRVSPTVRDTETGAVARRILENERETPRRSPGPGTTRPTSPSRRRAPSNRSRAQGPSRQLSSPESSVSPESETNA